MVPKGEGRLVYRPLSQGNAYPSLEKLRVGVKIRRGSGKSLRTKIKGGVTTREALDKIKEGIGF